MNNVVDGIFHEPDKVDTYIGIPGKFLQSPKLSQSDENSVDSLRVYGANIICCIWTTRS